MDFKAALEDLLKCPVCYDFLSTAMITKCGHNFCSLCIRKYLSVRSQCPVCFENASEPELANNRLVDEIIKSCNAILRSDQDVSKSSVPVNVGNDLKSGMSQNHHESADGDTKASCPVCNELIKIEVMNSHLDICLTRMDRKESLRKPIYPDKERKMAKVVYHLLSESDVRSILSDIGLTTEGDKQMLIKRHKAFLILYNAECDSLNPRPITDLIKQVQKEEVSERKILKQPKIFQLDKKSDPKLIEKEHSNYLRENKTQFEKLIEDVQSRYPHSQSKRTTESKSFTFEDIEAPSTSKQRKVDSPEHDTPIADITDDISSGRESPTF